MSEIYTELTAEDLTGNRIGIAFDCDSVMNQMGDNLGHYIAKVYGFSTSTVRATDEHGNRKFHYKVPGLSSGKVFKTVLKYILEESPSELATPYMNDVMKYIHDLTDVEIVVVTARPASTKDVTYNWLKENLTVPFICIMVPGHGDKTAILKEVETELFVDDRYRTVAGLNNIMPYSVAYTRPWNIGREEPGAFRVDDLRGIIPIANLLYGRNPIVWPDYIPHPMKG